MHCPFCESQETRVVDSRLAQEGYIVRRRRICAKCNSRFSTQEEAQLKLPFVVKSNGKREVFSENKMRNSFLLALRNRPVSTDTVELAISHIIRELRIFGGSEVPSRRIGEWIMQELKSLDQVAYVRFASVYHHFENVNEFREEIERLEQEMPVAESPQMPLLKPGKIQ